MPCGGGTVPIVIDGERIVIDDRSATTLAENLRVAAHNGDETETARTAADAIEAVLVGGDTAAALDDDMAEAIFDQLTAIARGGASPAVVSLCTAARNVHYRRLGWPNL